MKRLAGWSKAPPTLSIFIKKKTYTYKGKVTILEEEVELLIQHWYYSGQHKIDPSQEYSFGHGEQPGKTIYQFDGYVANDKFKPLLKIYVDSDKAEKLEEYIFVKSNPKPLNDCVYRAYSFGTWRPDSSRAVQEPMQVMTVTKIKCLEIGITTEWIFLLT